MNLLPFNADLSRRLHLKPYNFLVILPSFLMLTSMAPFFFILAPWLDTIFGISDSQPMRDQQGWIGYCCVLFVALILFMLNGFLLGWVLNAILLQVFYKWPLRKLQRAFLYSEVPDSWLKDKNPSDTNFNWSDKIKAFQSFRNSGTLRQNLIFRGLLAGLGMFLAVALLPVLNGKVEGTAFYFFWQACLWTIVGVLFGHVIWLIDRKFFRK